LDANDNASEFGLRVAWSATKSWINGTEVLPEQDIECIFKGGLKPIYYHIINHSQYCIALGHFTRLVLENLARLTTSLFTFGTSPASELNLPMVWSMNESIFSAKYPAGIKTVIDRVG